MGGQRRYAAIVMIIALSAGAMACGGGGGKSATATPSGSETAAPRPTPFATPLVVGNRVTSLKGYTATFPAGWRFHPNFINTVDGTIDAYFEPAASGPGTPLAQAQANIAVQCEVVRTLAPPEFLADAETRTSRLPQNKDVVVSSMKVSGVDATVLAYRFESAQDQNSPKVDKHDIIFSNAKCDWTITLSAPAGQFDTYRPMFDSFLNAFQLT